MRTKSILKGQFQDREIDRLKKSLLVATEEKEKLTAKLSGKNTIMESSLKNKERDLLNLRNENTELKTIIGQLKKDYEHQLSKLSVTHHKTSISKDIRIQALEQKLQQNETLIQLADELALQKDNLINALQQEKSKLKNSLEDMILQCASLRTELGKYKAVARDLGQKLLESERQSQSLKKAISQSTEGKDTLQQENKKLRDLLDAKNNQCASLIGENDRYKSIADRVRQKLIETQENLQSQAEMISMSAAKQSDLKNENEQLLKQNESLSNELKSIESVYTKYIELNASLIADVAKLKQECDNLSKERNAAVEALSNMEGRLSKAIEEAKENQETIAELQRSINELTSTNKDAELRAYENRIQQLEESIVDKNDTIRDLDNTNHQLEVKNAKLLSEVQELLSEINSLQSRLLEVEKELARIKEKKETILNEKKNVTEEKSDETDSVVAQSEQKTAIPSIDEPDNTINSENLKEDKPRSSANGKQKGQKKIVDDPNVAPADLPEIDNNQDTDAKRSIEYVYDMTVPEVREAIRNNQAPDAQYRIYSDWFFMQDAMTIAKESRRLALAEKNGVLYWVCGSCYKPVKVARRTHGERETLYFSHCRRTGDCVWKSYSDYGSSIEEATELETFEPYDEENTQPPQDVQTMTMGRRIHLMKHAIANYLSSAKSAEMGITDVAIDKTIMGHTSSMRWRNADIYFCYQGKKIVLELQTQQHSISSIVDRDLFYKTNGYYLLWIFGSDSGVSYHYLNGSNFKNTMFDNHCNVFIFDMEAWRASEASQMLQLKCNWLNRDYAWAYSTRIDGKNGELIGIQSFKFDENRYKIYYIDASRIYFFGKEYEKKKYNVYEQEASKQKLKEYTSDALDGLAENKVYEVKVFRQGDLWGFRYIDKELIPATFSSKPEKLQNGFYIVETDGKFGLIDNWGVWVLMQNYEHIRIWSDNVLAICEKQKWGFVDWQAKTIVAPKYSYLGNLDNNKALAHLLVDGQLLRGKVDNHGDEVTESVRAFDNGRIAIQRFERWGLTAHNGKLLLECEYEQLEPFGTDTFRFRKNGKWGIVDIHGRIIAEAIYSEIGSLSSGKAKAMIDDENYILTENGETFAEGFVSFPDGSKKNKRYGKWGMEDKEGNIIVEYKYDEIGIFRGRLIGFINGHVIKLNAFHNYNVPVWGTLVNQGERHLLFSIGGVECKVSPKAYIHCGIPLPEAGEARRLMFNLIDIVNGRFWLVPFLNSALNKLLSNICESDEKFEKDVEMNCIVTSVKNNRPKYTTITFENRKTSKIFKSMFVDMGLEPNSLPLGTKLRVVKTGYDYEFDRNIWKIVEIIGNHATDSETIL